MARQIYRQAALDRLASPEKIDRPYRLVGVSAWSAFAVTLGAIVVGIVWAFFAEAPVKVEAQGIVLPEEGLLEVVSAAEGRIERLYLQPGQELAAGDVVADFSRADLRRELEQARQELADAETRLAELTAFYEQTEGLQREAEDARLATIGQIRAAAARRAAALRAKIASLGDLVDRKIVIRDRLLDAEVALAEANQRLAELADEAQSIELNRLERAGERRLALIDEERKVESLTRAAEKLQQEFDEKRVAVSPHAGRVVEVRANQGDVVAPGSPLATLAPIDATGDSGILGVVYAPPAEGKRIAVGMRVESAPSTVRSEEYGFILGEVAQVSPVPATVEGMRSVLKNDKLAQQLSGEGAPFEVRIRFRRDPETPSGLAWSSSRGPASPIHPGTLMRARIVVEQQRLIDLVVPGASATLGRADG